MASIAARVRGLPMNAAGSEKWGQGTNGPDHMLAPRLNGTASASDVAKDAPKPISVPEVKSEPTPIIKRESASAAKENVPPQSPTTLKEHQVTPSAFGREAPLPATTASPEISTPTSKLISKPTMKKEESASPVLSKPSSHPAKAAGMQTQEASTGPSLFGTADQLAVSFYLARK